MESKCYDECHRALKECARINIKHAPNQVKGRMWAAIGVDEAQEPKTYGPIRYNIKQGMLTYELHIKKYLNDECIKQVDEYIANNLDFMIFVHANHKCVSLFNEEKT